ncbi:MAG: hypothetical protein R2681_04850 [Pyrinomonadaceae bacterium]
MKKQLLFTLAAVLFSVLITAAQEKPKTYEADPKDVESIDSIIKATYDSISGGIGVKRNWDRFNSLFHPSARLIPTGKNQQTGVFAARAMSPQDYIDSSGAFLVNNGFTEKEIARHTDTFGNIVQAFSSYEGTFTQNGNPGKIRGINSFQLMNDGKRWWIVTIFWQAEGADNPLPEKYLKNEN